MSFPILNGQVVTAAVSGKNLSTLTIVGIDAGNVLQTATSQWSMFQIPAVIDVSGMEFGAAVYINAGTVLSVAGMASGASTIVIRMTDGGTTGSAPANTNYLFGADTSFTATTAANTGRVADFSNSVDAGWTRGVMKTAVGTSTTDLDADDVMGFHLLANLSTAAGIFGMHVQASYIYGKPGRIA